MEFVIARGTDEYLVKIALGDGGFVWQKTEYGFMQAASFQESDEAWGKEFIARNGGRMIWID